MRICFASSECVPYIKTGGLADVSGALPKALAALGHNVKVFLPLYGSINTMEYDLKFAQELQNIPVSIGHRTVTFNTWYGTLPGSEAEVYLIDCPQYYHRTPIYDNAYRDEDERFFLLQHAAFLVMQRYAWSPDIIHCNDWQTALMPSYLRHVYGWDQLFDHTASLLSIHNIGFQGRFHRSSVRAAGLPPQHYYPGGPYELDGAFCTLKTGICFADGISTVSKTYAEEIQTPDLGADLDGVLRSRRNDLFGIVNGIDPDEWDPATDSLIPHNYSIETIGDKAKNTEALLREFGLPYDPTVPVLGIVSRLTSQKGFELLQPVLADLLQNHRFQLIALGSGEQRYEDFFNWAAATYPDRVACYIGYNNKLAHWIEAGADMFLMPSRYEPCGLNQMYSLAYGTVPIVRKTGGLADTVHDFHEHNGQGNGFSFVDPTPYALATTIVRALSLHQDTGTWRAIQQRGMKADFSWTQAADQYVQLYEHLAQGRR